MTLDLLGIGMTSPRTRKRMAQRLAEQGINDQSVLEVMSQTPRHVFVDEALASRAYEDTALPIGFNQTISQPYIVAKMTELLMVSGRLSKVLEIGTGCGYQTAILAQLVDNVYSVERILALQKKAREIVWNLKFKNVSYLYGDGKLGWADNAPFDGILVAAAAPQVPEQLLQQLNIGGVLVMPVGESGGPQILQRITRTSINYKIEQVETVSFVPFLSGKE